MAWLVRYSPVTVKDFLQGSNTKMRLYNIAVINDKTGKQVLLTGYPMPHKECCTMLSKMTSHKDTRKMLIEANQGEHNE
jgi:hypothetical protein